MSEFFKTKEGRSCWFSTEDAGMILLDKNIEKAIAKNPKKYGSSKIIRIDGESVFVWNSFLNKETKIPATKEQIKEKTEEFPPSIDLARIEKAYKGLE